MQFVKLFRWLLSIWASAAALALGILVLQLIFGKYDSQHVEPIIWFMFAFLPIGMALLADRYIRAESIDVDLPWPTSALALAALCFYLVIASLTILIEPFTVLEPVELIRQSYIWVIPIQAVATVLIVFALRRWSFRISATAVESELIKRVAEFEAKFAGQHDATERDARDNESTKPFDVFLAHSSRDKPFVRHVANHLRQRGLMPWLDEEQIQPGTFFQDVIQAAIPNVKTAAVFIGQTGLGKFQHLEIRTLITRCIGSDTRVIPVLLPGAAIPKNLLFLKELHWVQFENKDDKVALDNIQFGITGLRPTRD